MAPDSVSFCMMANFLAAALPRMTPALAEASAPRRVMVWNFIVVDDDLGGCVFVGGCVDGFGKLEL